MKIIYLLPPSEGKNLWWEYREESINSDFLKPLDIAINASEKDLKCTWKRYEQGIELNKKLCSPPLPQGRGDSEVRSSISRYSWVMYNAINYQGMTQKWKDYFQNNFRILSGMYWILSPLDMIENYKLPIETKWLYKFWWNQITTTLNNWNYDYIVDLLPGSYAKMIDWKSINTQVIRMNFMHQKNWELKKNTHWVKKVKGEYIYNLCEKGIHTIENLPGQKMKISENEYHINIIS
jgi:cytoplasmic iron level regulating protein YaaA (DUF328/UPF0246 family)